MWEWLGGELSVDRCVCSLGVKVAWQHVSHLPGEYKRKGGVVRGLRKGSHGVYGMDRTNLHLFMRPTYFELQPWNFGTTVSMTKDEDVFQENLFWGSANVTKLWP